MSWTTTHRRGDVLRAVIATANERRDGLLPTDVAGVAETFEDDLSLLGALQLKWHTRLNGHIERQLMTEPTALDAAVVAAWCGVAQELPGVRLVIDRYREHPTSEAMATAMGRATAKEHAFLATAAGLSSVGDMRSAPLGAELEERARALRDAMPVLTTVTSRPTLFDRLRAALAA